MLQAEEFRRYPKNTWRLTRLQQRYIKLKFEEENEDDLLSYSTSEEELRKHLINNFDFITSTLEMAANSTNSNEMNEQDSVEVKSVSSIPSLTSANTSSPSISVHSNFNDEHHSQQPQYVPEDSNMGK